MIHKKAVTCTNIVECFLLEKKSRVSSDHAGSGVTLEEETSQPQGRSES